MTQSDRPIANPLVVLREEFDDWAILFNPDSAEAIGINPIGVTIWKLLDGRSTVQALVDEVTQLFSEVPDSAAEEILEFLDELYQCGFIGYELERHTA